MSRTISNGCRFGVAAVAALAVAAIAGGVSAQTRLVPGATLPDFSGFWAHGVAAIDYESPPGGGPGPVQNTQSFAAIEIARNPIWVGNYKNPILQPWAAETVKKFGEAELAGHGPPTAQVTCMPSGVPNALTLMGPLQILQAPSVVALVHQRDHQVRLVYLNRSHSAHVSPTWYGESVGHYEGDTLVIDTIGLNDKTVTDRNGTPHSDALHVVERYRIVDGGKTMQVQFQVEDPKAFTTPWSAMVRFQRSPGQHVLEEEVCAENDFDVVTKKTFSIPTAAKADF
jgi:hypothetical protein